MIEYTLENRNGIYYLVNNGAVSIDYTFEKLTNCIDYETVVDSILETGEEVKIPFEFFGEYKLVLNILSPAPASETVVIPYYPDLETSIVESIASILCECGCENCSDSTLNNCDLVTARVRMDTYKRLLGTEVTPFFDIVYEETKCLIDDSVHCGVIEEFIKGETKCNTKLLKQFLALDYLALYYYKLDGLVDEDEISYIKSKYKSEKILCCIHKMCVDVDRIKQALTA